MLLEKIKLIIWDLDDTFWKGNLEEKNVIVPVERKDMLNNLMDAGIQNTICSKNNYEEVKAFLIKEKLWEKFVLPMINYNSKSENIAYIINCIHIQPQNILFIDDNIYNRKEVEFYLPNMKIAGAEVISKVIIESRNIKKKDMKHEIWKSYKLLEKVTQKRKEFSNNLMFLYQSKIKVLIKEDCLNEIERIYELGKKSNQLNFTKRKYSKENLKKLLMDKTIVSAYIRVLDKYGEYGVVGFYSIRRNQILDFYFSCRILGMGIEQYIYAILGYPSIKLEGKTSVNLQNGYCPDWIELGCEEEKNVIGKESQRKILVRGECDMKQMINYISSDEVIGEFDRNNVDENMGHIYNMHTEILKQALCDEKDKLKSIIRSVKFYDVNTFDFKMKKQEFDVILFGLSSDIRQGLYENMKTGEIIVVGDYLYPITVKSKLDNLYEFSKIRLNIEEFQEFTTTYRYIGPISKEKFTDNLRKIREIITKKTIFIFLKYPPIEVNGDATDRLQQIIKINKAVEEFCQKKENNAYALDLNTVIWDSSDCDKDNLHYKRIIYYYIARMFTDMLLKLQCGNIELQNYFLPYIDSSRQREIYKLFDSKKFLIIGLYRESFILGRNLRSKCYAVIDVNGKCEMEIQGMKILGYDILEKVKKEYYIFIHSNLKDNEKILRFVNKNVLKEYREYEYFA